MVSKNIVLLHGWGAKVGKLEPLAKELKKLGWKVFVPKLPGFDLKAPKKVWALDDYAKYILEKAQEKFGSKKFIIFGHSFGGRIAIKLAVNYFEKLRGIVPCAAGGISRGNPIKRGIFYCLAKIGKIFLIIPGFAKLFQKVLYKLAREHDYEKSEGIMKKIFRKVIAEDLKPLISSIKVPTLILWGKEDKMTPFTDALFIKNNLSSSKLVTYKDEGHQLPYRRPKKLAKEIEKWHQSQN